MCRAERSCGSGVSAGPGLSRRAGVSSAAPQRGPSALPTERRPAPLTALRGRWQEGTRGAVRTVWEMGPAVEQQGGRGGCCSPAFRARNEPLPPHPAGERLCSSKAPGRVGWSRPAPARGTVPDGTGRNVSSSLRRVRQRWALSAFPPLGAPCIPAWRAAVRPKSMGTFLLTGVKRLICFLFLYQCHVVFAADNKAARFPFYSSFAPQMLGRSCR